MESPEGWRALQLKWQGGSCRALAFDGITAFAGTHFAGVATLDSAKPESGWQVSSIQAGLPMRQSDKLFAPVHSVAVAGGATLVMAGGPQGLYRSRDRAVSFERASSREFADKVALPLTWLFCSGQHEVTVVSADETN